jgi:hypothetical protein
MYKNAYIPLLVVESPLPVLSGHSRQLSLPILALQDNRLRRGGGERGGRGEKKREIEGERCVKGGREREGREREEGEGRTGKKKVKAYTCSVHVGVCVWCVCMYIYQYCVCVCVCVCTCRERDNEITKWPGRGCVPGVCQVCVWCAINTMGIARVIGYM